MKEINALLLTNILCVSAMMAFLSVVGPIIRALGMAEWHAGVTVAIAGIVWIFLSRYWGKKSDKIGRKPVLLIGVAGFALFYFALSFYIDFALLSPQSVWLSLAVLILTRGLIGAFYSAIQPASTALIADKIAPALRASYIAKIGAASGLGMVIGPMAGGALAHYGLSVPLYASSILPLFALGALWYLLPSKEIRQEEVSEPVKIFDSRLRLPMSAAFLTMYSVVSSKVCTGFFILDSFKESAIQSAQTTGYVLSMVGFLFIFAQVIVMKKREVAPETWLKNGALLSMLGFLIVALMESKGVLMLGFGIAAIGLGMIFPAFQALAANSVGADEQGAAAGTVSSAQGMGIIIGPLASTALYQLAPLLPFLVASLAFATLTIMAFLTLRKEAKRAKAALQSQG